MSLDAIETHRLAVVKDSLNLKNRVDGDELRAKAELASHMTIAERLMRRVQITHFPIVFQDDLGDFSIDTRQLTSDERGRAMILAQRLAGLGDDDVEVYNTLIGDFKTFATEIVMTPGLEEYLLGTDVSDDVVIMLVMQTLNLSMQLVRGALTSFRKE